MQSSTRIGWSAVVVSALAAASTQGADQPNILLILADDVV
jgi:hypothetical protein